MGIEVREVVQPRSCQAFDVTEGSLDVDQSAMRSHWGIPAGESNDLIYIHF